MSDATSTEHAYLIAAEQARQAAEDAIHHFEIIAADFAAADPEGYGHYAGMFDSAAPELDESAAPEPEPITTQPGPRPTLDSAIRDMVSEQRARRAAG